MPLVSGSAASLPIIISLLAQLNEVGDQAMRFGTASHSAELVPARSEVQPALPTEVANQTTADFNEPFEEKNIDRNKSLDFHSEKPEVSLLQSCCTE